MKKYFSIALTGQMLLAFLINVPAISQTKLVLNGGKINITHGASLVLANPAADAIIRKSGHIISEGENNQIKWLTGNATGTYEIPFGQGNNDYLPLSFTKTAGSGNGHFLLATYGTSWQNNKALPTGITNLSGPTADNSAMVIDRFWRLNAVNYTTKPDLSAVTFSYSDSELAAPNTITEGMLGAQRWNESTNSWAGFLPNGDIETTQNKVTVNTISANDLFSWWTLVDRSSPLPLELISFEARKAGKIVKLDWVTAQEVNCYNFEIQRSSDGKNFYQIGTKDALGSQFNTYHFPDNNPITGTAYYRLKQNNLDGTFTFSPIRSVLTESGTQIIAFPNPVTDLKLQLVMGNAPLVTYMISVSDLKGTEVYAISKKIDSQVEALQLPRSLPTGIYLITLQHPGYLTQFKIVVR